MDIFWRGVENQNGFTLVELIIVISIMSLILGLAVVSVDRTMATIRLHNTANVLKSNLRLMQTQALSEGQYYEMRFDITLNQYRIFRGSNWVKTVKFEPGVNYLYARTSGGVTFSYLRYYPSGSPSSGATIAIEGKYAYKRYIIINPAIGRVRVSSQPPT